jgi:hypothetical protein
MGATRVDDATRIDWILDGFVITFVILTTV